MQPRLIIALFLLIATPAFAQEELELVPNQTAEQQTAESSSPSIVDPAFESPRATMITFLEAMNRYQSDLEANNVSAQELAIDEAVATLNLAEAIRERGPQLAKKLLLILNRLGEFRYSQLPSKRRAEGSETATYFPDSRFDRVIASMPDVKPEGSIVLAKQPDGRWLFSEETVAGIDVLYRSLEPLPILIGANEDAIEAESWLRRQIPEYLKRGTFLTVEYWQWIALLVLIFIGVAIDHLSRLFAAAVAKRMIRRRGAEPDAENVRLFVLPVGKLLMALFWLATLWL